jgi:diguanylate cyclase (GGDEF)-like protein
MSPANTSLSQQITFLSLAFGALLVCGLGWFGWWAASRIDDRSIARELRAILRGLDEIAAQVSIDQDTSIIWDDAVLRLRANDGPWMAENIAEWMSEYFSHDRIYILDSENKLFRAVMAGELADPSSYLADQAALTPLIQSLREQMSAASQSLTDSTPAINGLGTSDIVVLGDGSAAIASVRPVMPSSDALTQEPGSEFLHISIQIINQAVAEEIGQIHDVEALAFEKQAESDEDRIASPLFNAKGRVVGFFTWEPNEPAFELIHETALPLGGGVLLGSAAVALLLRRLARTSRVLEETKAEASFLAFHDPLTGIPNRALFEDRLDQALAHMRRAGSRVALHFIDLDRFKHVNDTLGHPAGDALIRQAAQRLSALVDEVDTVARLGGDEFAIVQFEVKQASDALALGQKIVEAFAIPFDLFGDQASVGASVGIVETTDAAVRADELMRQADIALYGAKDGGRGRYQLFAGDLDEAVRERRALENDLRHALATQTGLTLVYQPIYHIHSHKMAGAEALLRWNHPVHGFLPPPTFITLAEERGLIDQLGLWILRKACLFAAASDLPWVAVNVSPLQFRDEQFAQKVFAVLEETGLPAKRLEIEITEGLLLQNSPLIQSTLRLLRARGIRVALDDFGTGYSSISYLRTYGIDKLKIDQSFTAQLGEDVEIENIVQSIVDLGRAMRMVVTAEGVETLTQQKVLEKMGCNQLQGYLLARPMAAAALADLLHADTKEIAAAG